MKAVDNMVANAAYTAHQAQKAWTEKQQSQSGFYIEKVVPQMKDGNNEAHIEMIERFLAKPIEFTIDRNSANDLAMRGMEMQVDDLIKGLPYDSMAVILNRRLNVGGIFGDVLIKRIHVGVGNTFLPEVDEITNLKIRDFGKRLIWFIMNSNGRTWKDVDATFSTEPEFLKSLKSMSSVQMATTSGIGLIGSKYESHYIRDVLKETGAQALMDMMLKYKVGYENTEYMTWFCEFEHDGSTYHIYDWFHNGSISDLVTQLNAVYFEDGFNKPIWNFCTAFVAGLSSAWNDRQVERIEVKRKHTKRERKATGKRYSMAKVLKYNPDLGAIVDTKVVSVSEEPSEDGTGTGSKKSPHDRRETTWRPYVLNPREGEEILDVKEIRGKTRYQVERPRKGSKVHGGALSIRGVIKAV